MELALFIITALVAVASAIAMVASPNPVHSALFLITSFGAVAILFFLLGAPFIGVLQISIYAGAIMVLFLFVIMLLGAQEVEASEELSWQRPLALGLALVLVVEAIVAGVLNWTRQPAVERGAQLSEGFGTPQRVAQLLFTDYLLPFELISILLLVAMIGVVVLTVRPRS